MRTKSENPKKISSKENVWQTELQCDDTDESTIKISETSVKSDMNIKLINGSFENTTTQNHTDCETTFTYKTLLPFDYLKCKCFVEKKDQATQTLNTTVRECNESLAVNNDDNISLDLPSPSWSSDSESSLPQIPARSKPYSCSICTKSFPTPSKLRRHLLIHSGEKPYSCNICSKPFNDPANLKRHYWSHVKEKPFVCSECKGEYMTKRDAMMHLCPANKKRKR